MLSKSQISIIRSLQQKKFRKETELFFVEGIKSIREFIDSPYKVKEVFLTEDISSDFEDYLVAKSITYTKIPSSDLLKISALKTPQGALALIYLPPIDNGINKDLLTKEFNLVIDAIQDPGNMGTIIRTADWFGIKNIFCSLDTVDVYNPKVVQASMGSLAKISVRYMDLVSLLKDVQVPVYGALLEGESIYKTSIAAPALVVMGNEGSGISKSLLPYIQHAITIPRVGEAESLNVSVATAIICSELRRTT